MRKQEYSAGMVKLSFWFSDFRKVINLINQGKSLKEIKLLNLEENLFAAPTQDRAIQIFNTVSNRVKSLDQSFYSLFEQSDIATQKIINLIAIIKADSLFFNFVYEVYREKLIIGSDELDDSDIRIFFKNKQLQSEKVAKWTDYTLKRLGTCYKTMLMEAGLTDRSTGNRKILKPILDLKLEQCLKDNGMKLILHALTGVR
ncbi:hypothetical protein TCA2_5672 [Paenibacillus sp. TCA20]|uniref:DUF1819 family protein n=1 Tax=Paenibacillus sp. TCA20 TaxID=1499968 RepID=UPI0004DA9FFC|nr:DUF1819 family protein [Paenibacillus sp. TCA20]GAK43177.1 hypothetical protein TCA2_5672 [Paenibacillus sp. TCA20]